MKKKINDLNLNPNQLNIIHFELCYLLLIKNIE
jgi:hypothetical protein